MIRSIFAHDVTRVTIARSGTSIDIALHADGRTVPVVDFSIFGPTGAVGARSAPALRVDGADPAALVAVIRDALELLTVALEGAPANVPHAVFEARDALARRLALFTTTERA